MLADADQGDAAELQPLHAVHGGDCHLTIPRRPLGQGDRRDACADERADRLVDERTGSSADPDLPWLHTVVPPAPHHARQLLHFSRAGAGTVQDRQRTVDLGAAPGQALQVLVHIVDALTAQQSEAPPQDLGRRPVVDLQSF